MTGDTNLGDVEPKQASGTAVRYDEDGEPVDVTDEAGKGAPGLEEAKGDKGGD